jgi:hypothetical protein
MRNTNYQFGVWFTSVMMNNAVTATYITNLKFQVTTLSGTFFAEANSGFYHW